MGVARAPVVGSGDWPACKAKVSKPVDIGLRCLDSLIATTLFTQISESCESLRFDDLIQAAP